MENHNNEHVHEYTYLGQLVYSDGKQEKEIHKRIKSGWTTMGKHSSIFRSKMPMCLKRKVFDLPAMTYGCETWTLNNKLHQKLQTSQRSMESYMLGITRRDRKRNEWIRSQTKVTDIIYRIKNIEMEMCWPHSQKEG